MRQRTSQLPQQRQHFQSGLEPYLFGLLSSAERSCKGWVFTQYSMFCEQLRSCGSYLSHSSVGLESRASSGGSAFSGVCYSSKNSNSKTPTHTTTVYTYQSVRTAHQIYMKYTHQNIASAQTVTTESIISRCCLSDFLRVIRHSLVRATPESFSAWVFACKHQTETTKARGGEASAGGLLKRGRSKHRSNISRACVRLSRGFHKKSCTQPTISS